MFGLLCCLEEDDRIPLVIEGNWADLWQRLARPGDAADWAAALEPLTSQGLVAAVTDTGGDPAGFRVHPGVAAAGRAQAGDEFQAAVDHEAAAFWNTGFEQGREEETGWLIVRAGRAAVPYLLRLGQRGLALALLEQVLIRDRSPATIAALLPVLRQIADAAQGSDDEVLAGLLVARALEDIDPDASARQLHSLLTAVVERGNYSWASTISVYLIDNHMRAGRLTEALTLAGEKAEYTRRAGLGPWTQLQDEGVRLQILGQQGHADQVLAEVTRLRQQIAELPEQSDQPEVARAVQRARRHPRHRPGRRPPARTLGRRARVQRRDPGIHGTPRRIGLRDSPEPVQRLRSAAAARAHRRGPLAAAGVPRDLRA